MTKEVPSLSFLIQHYDPVVSVTTRLVFDLGIRREVSQCPEQIRKHVVTRAPLNSTPDSVASLAAGGLTPDDVDLIVLSHLHWDHVSTPADFQTSQFIVGNGSLALLRNEQHSGSHNYFETDLLPQDRTIELQHPDDALQRRAADSRQHASWVNTLRDCPWEPIGTFPQTLDAFQDGSLYIVWAPGHLPGHINLLCRKEDGSYVYLAGDAGHDMRLLAGKKDIAVWRDEFDQNCGIHQDCEAAQDTLSGIRKAWQGKSALGKVEVVLAHDDEWAVKSRASGRFFPGSL